jgi:integrase
MAAAKPKKLTDISLQKIKAPSSGRIEVWDPEFRAFGVRITDKGTKAFQLMYRFRGKLRRKTLGQYPLVTLAEAREQARAILNTAKAGNDPEFIEKEQAARLARLQANTFASVTDRFLASYDRRSSLEAQRYLTRDLADWAARPIDTITRRDVIAAIDAKTKDGVYAARRLLAYTRLLFKWAHRKDLVETSPVVDIEAPGTEHERDRVLSAAEIEALWRAWDRMEWPFGPMLKLLLLTGQRRDEVASIRWSDIRPRKDEQATPAGDFTAIEWVWTLPRESTKGDRSHEVPDSGMAMAILGEVPRVNSPYVFPARGNNERYATGYSRGKARSAELSGVADWRIHDLRRTAGTNLASMGIPVSTISRVLNHAEGGVTKIYNRHSYWPEKKAALDAWARKLGEIVGKEGASNIIAMRHGGWGR